MSARIITLTSDFGTRDPWVGTMKGVILGICPDVRLVDLSHDIAPQDILEGALCLDAAVPYFPAGTVHLAVVDPGVGSARRPMALESAGQRFVGPDNGLFTFALERARGFWKAVLLEAPAYRLEPVSRTFHGRDLFAPAAAHLAAGVPLERLGPAIADPVRLPLPVARPEGDGLAGEVMSADRFGNLLTSVTQEDMAALGGALLVEVAGRAVGAPVKSYADAAAGQPATIVGSTGRLEIFIREGNARAALGVDRGAPVRVRRFPSP